MAYHKPRHFAGLAAAAIATADAAVVYVSRDNPNFFTWTLIPCAVAAGTLALALWLAPNNVEPLLREKNTGAVIQLGLFLTCFGLLVAAARLLGGN